MTDAIEAALQAARAAQTHAQHTLEHAQRVLERAKSDHKIALKKILAVQAALEESRQSSATGESVSDGAEEVAADPTDGGRPGEICHCGIGPDPHTRDRDCLTPRPGYRCEHAMSTGAHRRWCLDCSAWCTEADPCPRCELAQATA